MYLLITTVASFEVTEPAPFNLTYNTEPDGSYTYTYTTENFAKTETRNREGKVLGGYSYVDDNGVIQKVRYIADERGFQFFGTNLPQGVTVGIRDAQNVLDATAQQFVDKHRFEAFPPTTNAVPALQQVVVHLHPGEHHEVVKTPPVILGERRPVLPLVIPEDPDDVKLVKAHHLAEVARLTQEHLNAVAKQKEVEAPLKPVEAPLDPAQAERIKAYHQAEIDRVTKEHLAAVVKQQHVDASSKPHQKPAEPINVPEDPEDIKAIKAHHLAEVARITQEHLNAVAKQQAVNARQRRAVDDPITAYHLAEVDRVTKEHFAAVERQKELDTFGTADYLFPTPGTRRKREDKEKYPTPPMLLRPTPAPTRASEAPSTNPPEVKRRPHKKPASQPNKPVHPPKKPTKAVSTPTTPTKHIPHQAKPAKLASKPGKPASILSKLASSETCF